MKLLFVCTGNTCRSVMAEHLLRKLAEDRGLGWTARSCGTAADPSFPVPSGVKKALAGAGIPRCEHRAQPLSRGLVDWADLALGMTREHARAVSGMFPDATAKAKTLRGLAGLPGEDIPDPIGGTDEVYAECRDRILEALEVLVERHEHA